MTIKNLLEVKSNTKYKIVDVLISNKQLILELDNFGLCKGNYVSVIASNYGKKSYLILVDGGYFAIDKMVCEKIMVNE